MTHKLLRPEPITQHTATPVERSSSATRAAEQLRDGTTLVVKDHYGTGVQILAALQALIARPGPSASYADRKGADRRYREASLRLLAPIKRHRLALDHAEPNGFLAELYPELISFYLPFAQAQELHGAFKRYQEGVKLAVLGHPVHPFYGTYAPTRTSHLELFATWLSAYDGPRTTAVDVGTGCGVLALMLAKAGFSRVIATDNNPNAVESVTRELVRLPSAPPIEPRCCDLLGDDTSAVDLVVFNPPWIQGEVSGLIDGALYFQPGLFERFFDQATERLAPEGRIAVIFSNVIGLVQPGVRHPIEAELARGRLRLVQKLRRKVKPPPGPDGSRRRTKERVEVWELARLESGSIQPSG